MTDIPLIDFDPDKAQLDGFELIDLNTLFLSQETMAHQLQTPHRVDFHHLIYIEQARGRHLIDFTYYPYQANCFIFVQKGQVHAFDFLSAPKGKIIAFTQAFLNHAQEQVRLPSDIFWQTGAAPVVNLQDDFHHRAHNIINELSFELTHPKPAPLIALFLFASLLLMVHRARPASGLNGLSKNQNVLLEQFLTTLRANYDRTRDANWYAQQIHTSYKNLNHLCKLSHHKTAKQLIDDYVVLEAKRRLVLDQTQTQQLAYALGFEDDSNFVKFFKKHTHMTPSQFKKQAIA